MTAGLGTISLLLISARRMRQNLTIVVLKIATLSVPLAAGDVDYHRRRSATNLACWDAQTE
jgi:hypothetical protein